MLALSRGAPDVVEVEVQRGEMRLTEEPPGEDVATGNFRRSRHGLRVKTTPSSSLFSPAHDGVIFLASLDALVHRSTVRCGRACLFWTVHARQASPLEALGAQDLRLPFGVRCVKLVFGVDLDCVEDGHAWQM